MCRWLGLKWVCRRNRVFTTRATNMTRAASALSPTSRARKSHEIIAQGLQILINLDHRGAVGADPLVGDGAGCLIQIPDALFRDWAAERRRDAAAARPLCRGHVLPAARSQGARHRRQAVRALHQGRRPGAARLARCADRSHRPRQDRARTDAADPPGDHRPRARTSATRTPSSASCSPIRKQTQNPLAELAKKHKLPAITAALHAVASRPARVVYKGLLLAHRCRAASISTCRTRSTESAMALVHQRFSTNTFPSWKLAHPYPLHRPQRRDQHAARQRQLDERAPPHAWNRDLLGPDLDKMWPLIPHGQSDTASLDNALELLIAGGYPLAHADDDADPGSLGRQQADGCQAPGLLRISRRADGAVGRPRRHRLHRRPPDRRHARPQRPAPRALHRHRRRSRDHGLGIRRAAGPGREDRAQMAPAARQDAADRPRRRPHRRGRGDQGASSPPPSPTRNG